MMEINFLLARLATSTNCMIHSNLYTEEKLIIFFI